MNRFRKQNKEEKSFSNHSDKENDPFNQLKACKEKLRDLSDDLKNLSNHL